MKRQVFATVWVCLAVLAMVGTARALTVTDAVGRRVDVPEKPSRVVCLGPGCLRLLVYLGAAEAVVGIEQFEKRNAMGRPYRLAHPELLDKPVISPGGPQSINQLPDIEGVLAVTPQLIFVTFMEPGKADALQSRIGIPVVVLGYGAFATFDDRVFDSVAIAGTIMGRADRATALTDYTRHARQDVRDRAARAGGTPPRAYVGGTSYKGTHGITSTDNPYIPLDWLGVVNPAIAEAPRGHVFLDKEKLLAADPETVFLDAGGLRLVAEDYAAAPAYYQNLAAFGLGRVFVLYPFTSYVTNIETMIADAYAAGKILFPEAFADVDLSAKTAAVYTFFTGKDVSALMAADYGALGEKPQFLSAGGKAQ